MAEPDVSDTWKQQAALRALSLVKDGMRLGLGTGSTAAKFLDLVGQRVKEGLKLVCVPTSEATRIGAERLGLTLSTLESTPFLDLTVDGAEAGMNVATRATVPDGSLLTEKIATK